MTVDAVCICIDVYRLMTPSRHPHIWVVWREAVADPHPPGAGRGRRLWEH